MEFALAMTSGRPQALAVARRNARERADGRRQPNGRYLAVSTEVVQPCRAGNGIGPDLHDGVRNRLHALEQLHPRGFISGNRTPPASMPPKWHQYATSLFDEAPRFHSWVSTNRPTTQ